MPKVSVIIPVYNVEQYLRNCLDSVINQTLKDIEIICVDDGSPDNCGAILDEYASKDNRIKVIHQENKGVAVARNRGLDIASGEYISFLDPDDMIDLNFYEILYPIEKKYDIVKGGFNVINKNKKHISKLNDKINQRWYYFTCEWVSAIYRKSLIEKIRFPEGFSNGEDCVFLNKVLLISHNIGVNNDVFYHYIRRDNSLDTFYLSSSKINSIIFTRNIVADNLNNSNLYMNDGDAYNYLFYDNFINIFYLLMRTKKNNDKKYIIYSVIDLFHKCKDQQYIENNFPYKWMIHT